jgi:hypothetical protein
VGRKQFGCVQRTDPTPSGPATNGEKATVGQKLMAAMKKAEVKVQKAL